MSGTQVPGHLACLKNPMGLAPATIVPSRDGPEMVCRAERRRSVLGCYSEDLLFPLRVHTEHRRRFTVGSHDEVTDGQLADGTEARGSQYLTEDRLSTAAHVRQGGDLDRSGG